MNTLFITRHGKTDWNLEGLIQGSVDIPLNDIGKREALELAKSSDLQNIDICLSSPLKRAYETAQILSNSNFQIIVNELLVERGFGDLEGTKNSDDLVKKEWDYSINDKSFNIESIKECLKRAKTFLEYVKKEYPDKTILIVSHAAFIKALHYNLVGYDENTDFLDFSPQNAKIYKYYLK